MDCCFPWFKEKPFSKKFKDDDKVKFACISCDAELNNGDPIWVNIRKYSEQGGDEVSTMEPCCRTCIQAQVEADREAFKVKYENMEPRPVASQPIIMCKKCVKDDIPAYKRNMKRCWRCEQKS